jgi:hypothetical protein
MPKIIFKLLLKPEELQFRISEELEYLLLN